MNHDPLPIALLDRIGARLSRRVDASARHARTLHTVRARDREIEAIGRGLRQTVIVDPAGAPPAADGSTWRLRTIDVDAGVHGTVAVAPEALGEWLVVAGAVELDGEPLGPLDFLALPAGAAQLSIASAHGARLMLRESLARPGAPTRPLTRRDADGAWHAGCDGIKRRLLWHDGDRRGVSSYLLRVAPGSSAPSHRHRRAEDCYLLHGELHLEDVLLFGGDYQCAPPEGVHHSMTSDRGALVFLHGDTELDFIEPDADDTSSGPTRPAHQAT